MTRGRRADRGGVTEHLQQDDGTDSRAAGSRAGSPGPPAAHAVAAYRNAFMSLMEDESSPTSVVMQGSRPRPAARQAQRAAVRTHGG
ncbi:hypothetical protein FB570_109142 [Streptomyces sp. T12]|nr:hypothetical protein FB570_109142 [Streptomyces sp. T12]